MRRVVSVHLLWAADLKDYSQIVKDIYKDFSQIKDDHAFFIHKKKVPFRHWR